MCLNLCFLGGLKVRLSHDGGEGPTVPCSSLCPDSPVL